LTYQERISSLIQLGTYLSEHTSLVDELAKSAHQHNQWFTPENVKKSIKAICTQFLEEEKITQWASSYSVEEGDMKTIGLVLAGNIPLVGWHDVMCCFMAGHKSIIKYSSKDELLIPALIKILGDINEGSKKYFEKVEFLKGMDAVIATGGDTASTHFNYYFSKYPHIIRKNRSSCAVLTGDETKEELEGLSNDIFEYFGLGCRSVSKIYFPVGYDHHTFFEACMNNAEVINHNKYKNNFDYTNALYLIGQFEFLTNNFVILREASELSSRISCVHAGYYTDIKELEKALVGLQDQVQCVSTKVSFNNVETTPLGQCQRPGLADYADGVDTMKFLTQL